MFMGQGIRNLLRAAYFLIIPRFLGVKEYGLFVGVASLIAILAPFATLGIGSLLVKNVSRDKNAFSEYWGNALFVSLISGAALIGLSTLLSRYFLPRGIPWVLILLVALSDLLFARVLDVACLAFQAFDMLAWTAKLNIVGSAVRLVAAVVLVASTRHVTALTWGWFYLASTILSCAVALVWIRAKLGAPRLALHRIKAELMEGFYFSVSLSSQSIYNDIDKTMLARLSTLDATGVYGAAYRVIDVACTPVRALLSATYASFFRHGTEGLAGTTRYAKRLLPRAGAYSLLAALALFFGAPILPHLLGKEYLHTVEALRWLSPLPFLKTVHSFLADALTGAGWQGIRTIVQVVVALANVLMNFWLIPAYSWRGAAWASLASDGLLALSLWLLLIVLRQQEQRPRGIMVNESV